MGLGVTIFRHTVIYSAATAIGRLASFLMLPFYAHIFQAQGYGIIGMIDTVLSILTVLLGYGFQTAILRIYHEQQGARKSLVLGTGIRLVWCIGACLVALPMAFSTSISHFFLGSIDYAPLICLAMVTLVIDTAGEAASTIQVIQQRSLQFSTVNLLRLFIGLGLNIWLVVILQVGLKGIFISSLVSAVFSSSIYHVLAIREHGLGFDRILLRDLIRFQLPLLPGEIISFFGRQADRVLVRFLIGLEGVGVLEMAYKFPPLINMFINIPFQRAWRTKSFEIANQDGAPQYISIMFTRYLFLMVFAGLLLAVNIRNLLELMTPQEFWTASKICHVEIVSTILSGCSGYLTFGLVFYKRTATLSLVKSILTPLKIFLGVILISSWGLAGAAYSALLIEIITLGWLGSQSQKLYRIPLEYTKIAIILLCAGGLFWALEGNTYGGWHVADFVRQQVFEPLTRLIQGSPLGGWKSGKLIILLREKQDLVLYALLNSFFCFSFLALFPVVQSNFFKRKSV